jgi:hypothetical protein
MNVYQGKERRIRMADRRVNKTTDVRLCIPCIDRGAPFGSRIGVADRRANATEPPNPSDTAELLKKYRVALITAYELGESIKEVYGILPPKAIIDWDNSTGFTISLNVN